MRVASVREAVDAHPRLAAVAAGAIAATGFQPLSLWPLTLLALAGLHALVARAGSLRAAALTGWAFGVGLFTVGNNWIATSFTYQADMPVWLGWIAVAGLAIYLALFPAMATAAGWWLGHRRPVALVLALAGSWIVGEWLRGWVFTGFAWNPVGVALLGGDATPGVAFIAPWTGTYGLSGIAMLLGAAIWRAASPGGRALWLPAGLIALVVAAVMVLPARHLPDWRGPHAFTLVQPDIRQDVLNEPAMFAANRAKIIALSAPLRPGERRLVLWPESGVPDYLRDGYPAWLYTGNTFADDPARARGLLSRAVGRGGLLLTGTTDLEIERGEAIAARNVVTALDDSGRIVGSYAKSHLVPYGEYLALRWLLEPLGASRLVPGAIDFWPGPGPRTLDLGSFGRPGVQVCYEIIFSGAVVDPENRPDFIFNPSNDGWFGAWGPPQHLAQARLRAIEEGLPVLRATTTGISAVIDAGGVVRQHLPRHRAGRIDGLLPLALPPTLFARFGNAVPLWGATVLLLASLVASRRRSG